jgi:peroxidase
VDLLSQEGLFTSDQDLLTNATTRPRVTKLAVDQNAFFEQLVYSYVKMGQINVLTGCHRDRSARKGNDGEMPWSSAV